MKKIFYLLFLIILCFTFNIKINAENTEEIDCDTHPYACVKCTYDVPYDTLEFIAYSDGKVVQLKPLENNTIGPDIDRINQNFDDILSFDFELTDENKLACPKSIFYTDEFPTQGKTRKYTFNVDLEKEQKKVDLGDEKNNDKYIREKAVEMLTCTYDITDEYKVYATVYKFQDETLLFYSSNKYKVYGNNVGIEYFMDENGNVLPEAKCPTLYIHCIGAEAGLLAGRYECSVSSSSQGVAKPHEATTRTDGTFYKYLLGSLKMPLSMLYGLPLNFTLQVGDNPNFIFENIEANNDLCSNFECIDNANYYVEKGLKNIRSYCNDMYSKYEYYKDSDSIDERMNECISFNQFYSQLVNEGIVNDLADYCGILSEDFVKKLSFVLNIIMIAGPILAILLGTVDFIKVIANGDADKEMKTAFKHFMIRVGSAALLFIVPLLLSFILNIFMANEGGYDPENPFCNVNDWSE